MAGEHVANVAVVLLAGGVGSRMKAGKPKQFLELEGKTILRTSLDVFLGIEGVASVSVVLAEEYRDQLADVAAKDPRESATPTCGAPRACLPRQPRLCRLQRESVVALSLPPWARVVRERRVTCRVMPSLVTYPAADN
jgi:bifunctional N-acetylglucosamine-1-phosphate-uridyltransferase/glucosamine-1-phosphate-acetyltransferase GlmU-like protein